MPFVSGFLAAASFYFDVRAAYFVAHCFGTILTGFPDHNLFDNPFLLADHRFLAGSLISVTVLASLSSIADGPVDRASLHDDSLIMQSNRLFHRFLDHTTIDTHPSAFELAL